MKKYKCSCGCENMFVQLKGNNTGLYCSECGKWQRWLSKNERRAYEHSQKILVQMRDPTLEEIKALSESIDSISKPTGIIFFDEKSIIERFNEFVEYIDRKIDSEYEKIPVSKEDAIRKNSYCLALEQDKRAILNILNGHDFNYIED